LPGLSVAVLFLQVIVCLKWLCQFVFMSWNATEILEENPFYLPRIIGIERKSNYATYDLLLLLTLYFHR